MIWLLIYGWCGFILQVKLNNRPIEVALDMNLLFFTIDIVVLSSMCFGDEKFLGGSEFGIELNTARALLKQHQKFLEYLEWLTSISEFSSLGDDFSFLFDLWSELLTARAWLEQHRPFQCLRGSIALGGDFSFFYVLGASF